MKADQNQMNLTKPDSIQQRFLDDDKQKAWDKYVRFLNGVKEQVGESDGDKTSDEGLDIVSFKLKKEKKRQLETYAKNKGISVSQVLKNAVDTVISCTECFFCGASIPKGGICCPMCGKHIPSDAEYYDAALRIKSQMQPELDKKLEAYKSNLPDFVKEIRYCLSMQSDGSRKEFVLTLIAYTEDDVLMPISTNTDITIPIDKIKDELLRPRAPKKNTE